jgi:hypothetical protein
MVQVNDDNLNVIDRKRSKTNLMIQTREARSKEKPQRERSSEFMSKNKRSTSIELNYGKKSATEVKATQLKKTASIKEP